LKLPVRFGIEINFMRQLLAV